MSLDPDTSIGGPRTRFPDTCHSAIIAIQRGDGDERTRALDTLIAIYWKPVYKHIRVRWRMPNEEAKDLTQGFFALLLEKDFLDGYDPGRGTFRTFVRTCVDRFLANELKAGSRLKRGGGTVHVSLDFPEAEQELLGRLGSVSPEETFDAEWMRSLFSLAVERMKRELEEEGKEVQLRLFELYDLGEDAEKLKGKSSKLKGKNGGEGRPTYEQLARDFGLTPATVTNWLAAARRRFRRIVLEMLRESTADDREFRCEARALLGVDPE